MTNDEYVLYGRNISQPTNQGVELGKKYKGDKQKGIVCDLAPLAPLTFNNEKQFG